MGLSSAVEAAGDGDGEGDEADCVGGCEDIEDGGVGRAKGPGGEGQGEDEDEEEDEDEDGIGGEGAVELGAATAGVLAAESPLEDGAGGVDGGLHGSVSGWVEE
jgi:hypothetical protein